MRINNFTSFSKITGLAAFMLFFISCSGPEESGDMLVSNVNPFIGTGGHGHTYPGAALPFGMVQLSPDNGTSGWDWCSGYHITDSVIAGFSHLHLSGTGIGDLADISVLPVNGEVHPDTAKGGEATMQKYWSRFSHTSEKAEPGYYSVYLKDPKVRAELTTTLRTGFHRYTFDAGTRPAIAFDLGFHINWDHPLQGMIRVSEEGLITGYRHSSGWARDQIIYFAARFNKPFTAFHLISGGRQVDSTSVTGTVVQGVFDFQPEETEPILLKVGLSTADIAGAVNSLNGEIQGWDFDEVQQNALETWERQLNRVRVKSSNPVNMKIFYTALYHVLLEPALYSDRNGNYTGPDHKVHSTVDYNRYTVFSLWDTFRAAHPLYTVIYFEEVQGLINSMLSFYRESGLLPVWELHGNETNTMIGYHSIPVIADAILKGFGGFDAEEAFEAMKKSSMQDREGLKYYREYGYVPAELETESVSKTLEYAYDDWCIAAVAKHLGHKADFEVYAKRAENYKNLFDPVTRFMRGKLQDGTWRTPFDPLYSKHGFSDYTEGNAWQYSWFVPHDVQGLIGLMGGNEQFAGKLDSLFNSKEKVKGAQASPDISGLIGQYAHGNEPSHQIAYLYNYAGKPWKTQAMVRRIMKEMYRAEPDGLSGNEDCGQMSAWYIFSAMGFYPVNPAQGIYVLGSPVFDEVSYGTGKGKRFRVIAHDNTAENVYIQKAQLNGKPLKRSYIYHRELMKGGILELWMGNRPNKELWTDTGSFPPPGFAN